MASRLEVFSEEEYPYTSDRKIQLSVAFSLKRIADALWGTEDTTGIIQLLNGVEMNGRNNG